MQRSALELSGSTRGFDRNTRKLSRWFMYVNFQTFPTLNVWKLTHDRIDGGPRRAFAQAWLHPVTERYSSSEVGLPRQETTVLPVQLDSGPARFQHHRGLDWRLGGRNIVAEVDVAVDDGRVLSFRVDQHLRLSAGKNDVICRDRRVALDRHLTGTHGAHADGTNSTIGILRRGCDHNLAGIDKRHGQQTRFSCRWPQLTPFCPESPVVRRCLQIHLPNLRTSISFHTAENSPHWQSSPLPPALARVPQLIDQLLPVSHKRHIIRHFRPQSLQIRRRRSRTADSSSSRHLSFPGRICIMRYVGTNQYRSKHSNGANHGTTQTSSARRRFFSPQDRHQAPSLRRRRK